MLVHDPPSLHWSHTRVSLLCTWGICCLISSNHPTLSPHTRPKYTAGQSPAEPALPYAERHWPRQGRHSHGHCRRPLIHASPASTGYTRPVRRQCVMPGPWNGIHATKNHP